MAIALIVYWWFTMLPVWERAAQLENTKNAIDMAHQLQQEQIRREATTYMWIGVVHVAQIALGASVLLGVFFVIVRIQNPTYYLKDGAYPLLTRWTGNTWNVIDPNKAIEVNTQVSANSITQTRQFVDPNAQLHLLDSVQRTRTIQAANRQSVRYANHAKLLAGMFDRPVQMRVVGERATVQPEPNTAIVRLPLREVIAQSDQNEWVLGQSPNDGTLFRFNLGNSVHLGLVGATKSGKTSSTAYLLTYYARFNGFHVIALDGAGGVDWKPWSNYAEVYDTTYLNLPAYISQINQLHNQRMTLVKQYGVATIDEITDLHIPHTLVVMEEFGFMMQALKSADRGTYDQTESTLSNLMRVSRKSGIHFLLIDQNPAKWPSSIVANIKQYVAYKVGGKVGSAINEYHLDDLKPVGQFSVENQKYDAWYTKGELPKLLPDLRQSKVRYIKECEPPVTTEPVTAEGVFSGKIDVETPPEKTGYVTSYQSAEVVTSGSKLVIAGSEKTTPVTSYNHLIEQAVTNKKPLLSGGPTSQEDYELVYRVFMNAKSHNKAYLALWGGKNGQRQQWRDEAMAKFTESD
ncbi:MAG: hypothetical protein IT190_07695 [Microbacteriaceae bacterium]|nr:hypothetical protein [Microbacteriaceae bacterium]